MTSICEPYASPGMCFAQTNPAAAAVAGIRDSAQPFDMDKATKLQNVRRKLYTFSMITGRKRS
jgi:hypothetical protein